MAYDGPLDSNLSSETEAVLDLLFAQTKRSSSLTEWTHAGMAWGFGQRMNRSDLEEFIYCLNEQIKVRYP
jgi:hypothetical protein